MTHNAGRTYDNPDVRGFISRWDQSGAVRDRIKQGDLERVGFAAFVEELWRRIVGYLDDTERHPPHGNEIRENEIGDFENYVMQMRQRLTRDAVAAYVQAIIDSQDQEEEDEEAGGEAEIDG